MLTTTEILKFANLQMASEALLNKPEIGERRYSGDALIAGIREGNNRSLKFTPTQAQAFADPNTGWTVLAQTSTTTGFSGTLFYNTKTFERVLSFRSTEFIDDHARDNQATNAMELAEGGFALGQIADMEAWYKTLAENPAMLKGQTFSVTGYSLGGHLATTFNLLRQQEAQAGPVLATLDKVVTFNGAGVGQIGRGSLTGMVSRFAELLAQSQTDDGLTDLFQTQEGRNAYTALRAARLSNPSITWAQMRDVVANAFTIGWEEDALRAGDRNLLIGTGGALTRAERVYDAAHYAPERSSGDSSPSPKNVPDGEIGAESFDYQLAVLTTRREFATRSRSIAGDAMQLISSGGLARLNGTPTLGNQYDVVGWEYSSPNPVAMVAHSLWHHGSEQKVFIEDQPNSRGGIVLSSLLATLASADVRLLVDDFAHRDFGDDHSLTLIVDSLSVQSTILDLSFHSTDFIDGQRAAIIH